MTNEVKDKSIRESVSVESDLAMDLQCSDSRKQNPENSRNDDGCRNRCLHSLRRLMSLILRRRAKSNTDRQDSISAQRQLESPFTSFNSSVLSPSENIHRRDSRTRRSQKAKKTRGIAGAESREGRQIMPTQTLPANSYIYFKFHFRRRGVIKFYVEAELPVDTYVVDEPGFENFTSGYEFTTYGGFTNREKHQQELRVPFEGYWYLIIQNHQIRGIAVHYEVYG